jgi:hypothetical protein
MVWSAPSALSRQESLVLLKDLGNLAVVERLRYRPCGGIICFVQLEFFMAAAK